MNTCTLVFDYFGSDGRAHCHANCGECYTVEFAYLAGGPWYFYANGVVGQDIPIEPMSNRVYDVEGAAIEELTSGTRYFRVVPRECTPAETIDPVPEAPPAAVIE